MARALWLPDALKSFSVPYVMVAGWETRGEQVFDPAGVMNHHTADPNPASSALSVIVNGRSDLPGPLANIYIEWDGTVYIVASGEANHAGWGVRDVLDRVRTDRAPKGDARTVYGGGSDEYVGNDFYIGIEVQHPGDSSPYPDAVIRSTILTNAAICAHQGWTHNRCVHHREHTARKTDMSWRGDLRGEVAQAIKQHQEVVPVFTPIERKHAVKDGDGSRQSDVGCLARLINVGYGAVPKLPEDGTWPDSMKTWLDSEFHRGGEWVSGKDYADIQVAVARSQAGSGGPGTVPPHDHKATVTLS